VCILESLCLLDTHPQKNIVPVKPKSLELPVRRHFFDRCNFDTFPGFETFWFGGEDLCECGARFKPKFSLLQKSREPHAADLECVVKSNFLCQPL
jgi:hypothetical protein